MNLTKREHFALAAMEALINKSDLLNTNNNYEIFKENELEDLVVRATVIADAMIEELKQENK